MKTTRILLTVSMVVILLLTVATSAFGGQPKVDVCHITGTYDFGGGPVEVGHVINIADPAYDKHIAHGDPEVWNVVTLDDGSEVCTAGSAEKTVFVTVGPSGVGYQGYKLLGLTGADAKCQARATAASLDGTYKAWLSSAAVNASDRLSHSTGPYVLTNGTKVADDWADLIDSDDLYAAINVDEFGGSRSTYVWTATNPDGTYAGNPSIKDCGGWSSTGSGQAAWVGDSGSPGSSWTNSGSSAPCTAFNALYCFEQ
jgi:hypothetical protein